MVFSAGSLADRWLTTAPDYVDRWLNTIIANKILDYFWNWVCFFLAKILRANKCTKDCNEDFRLRRNLIPSQLDHETKWMGIRHTHSCSVINFSDQLFPGSSSSSILLTSPSNFASDTSPHAHPQQRTFCNTREPLLLGKIEPSKSLQLRYPFIKSLIYEKCKDRNFEHEFLTQLSFISSEQARCKVRLILKFS